MTALRAALVDTEHTRRRNRAFLGELTARAAERPGARSLALLAARAEQVRRGPDARRVQWGRTPWTARELGLQRHAETAALEAVIAEDTELARWLCDAILEAGKSAATQGVLAVLAVHDGDLSAARRLRERELKVLAGAYSRAAAQWTVQQSRRLAARRAYLPLATPGETEDAAARWAAARGDVGRLAGAVAEANRIGGSGSTGASFEDAFARRLVTDDPTALGRWAAALAPAPVEPGELAEPGAVADASVLTRRALRAYLAGRELSFGADSADAVVVRIDAIAKDAGRTDIHVVTDPETASWAIPVHARIVLGPQRAEWQHTLRTRLRPKAQRWIGDDELRRVAPAELETVLRDLAASA